MGYHMCAKILAFFFLVTGIVVVGVLAGDEGALITQIFTPGLHEIWMRLLGAFLIIIIFGVYAQFISRKRAVEALRESEENIATTLNSIGDAVIATDCSRGSAIASLSPGATTTRLGDRFSPD